MQIKNSYQNENHKNNYQKLATVKIAITWKQYIFQVVNNAWNFHFLWINVVIQAACVVSWTSIFTNQMIVIVDFFISWLEWFGADEAVHGIFVLPPLLLGQLFSWEFYWPGVVYKWLLWLRPGPKTFQRRHLLYSLGGGSKYCSLLHFM